MEWRNNYFGLQRARLVAELPKIDLGLAPTVIAGDRTKDVNREARMKKLHHYLAN